MQLGQSKIMWGIWTHNGEFPFLYLNFNAAPINSAPRQLIGDIRQIELQLK